MTKQHNSRPLVPVSPQGLDEIALALLKGSGTPNANADAGTVRPAVGIINPREYIILPSTTHGTYRYPDLLVAKHRLGYDTDVKRAAKELGLHVQNTAQEQDGTVYIGEINWENALKLNAKLGNVTLNIRQFLDFQELLKAGMGNARKVYDGAGTKLDSAELTRMYNEIREVRDPWRSEWLDNAFFKVSDTVMGTRYGHSLASNGTLKAAVTEHLGTHLREDTWIDESRFNTQGLPTTKSSAQILYYWFPRDGAVAGFYADSGGAWLVCGRDPSDTIATLGVRAARAKK
ncbi:MAG: hypothetical protein Q7R87_04255 [Nanoarchaeota archaeon]|nr:hypothetical protein [Nanoarchaeota archaeon]